MCYIQGARYGRTGSEGSVRGMEGGEKAHARERQVHRAKTRDLPNRVSSARLTPARKPAEPVLVVSRCVGSAQLKNGWAGWLSYFEPSCGNTSCT